MTPPVGTVPEGRKPLLEVLIEELQARGFHPVKDDEYAYLSTMWTHPDWAEWWLDRTTGEKSERHHLLMETVAQIVGEESGWNAITKQDVS